MYQSVVSGESDIGSFTVGGITDPHPFHVVYTRNTNAKNYSEEFLACAENEKPDQNYRR